jgi:predicted DNA-binding transcriptional regulator AlpA
MTEQWVPRGLREEQAAHYVGLSVSSFRSHVAADVPPVRITPGRNIWLREHLDAWLNRRAGISPEAGLVPQLDPYEELMRNHGTH